MADNPQNQNLLRLIVAAPAIGLAYVAATGGDGDRPAPEPAVVAAPAEAAAAEAPAEETLTEEAAAEEVPVDKAAAEEAPVEEAAESVFEANVKLLEAGDTVTVSKIPDGIYLRSVNDPDDIIWERLPEYRVHVAPAPSVHRSVELRVNYDDPGHDLYLTLARTSERFYVRMRWRDDSADRQMLRDRFCDGAAVQFSLGDDATSYLMGTGPEAPVNIWYWSAGGRPVQNLAAGGYGSLTPLDTQSVTGDARYEENTGDPNEWTVVMSRPIAVSGDYEAALDRAAVPMAFAVWQGSEGQRDGLKSVSDGWILVDMSVE